ncbi:hypothetical protein [Caldalkalibacillus salinus]|uniref:hypothetical protein n=1 Tax=Caldalkalibacillus salinus TaxID=2803787 RepID=UPI001924DAFA|nr:hypothetical protein [Caldalkalibacillus salinus]
MSTILFLLISIKENLVHDTAVNEKVDQIRDFSVNTDSTDLNTSVKGTVFIRGEEGIPEHVQIVASIEIDPNDWGGVAFYVPDKWYISNIKSSFTANETQSKPRDYVSTWTTEEHERNAFIEVGRDTGGGTGTLVIDIVPDQNVINPSETFNISVSVGSDEKNGTKIVGTDSISVPISLTDNE